MKDITNLEKRTQHFITRADKIHNNKFNYSKSKYINAKSNIIIICPIHGEFKQTPDKHLAPKSHGCQKCWSDIRKTLDRSKTKKQPHTSKEKFLEKANKKYKDYFEYDLSNFSGICGNIIKIKCPQHGWFSQKPRLHTMNAAKYGCRKCAKEQFIINNSHSYDFIIKRFKKLYPKYIYPESNKSIYINQKTKITIICPKHGEFIKSVQKHLIQECPHCGIETNIKLGKWVGQYCPTIFDQYPDIKNSDGYLYYFRINFGKFYKIGITTNLKQRLKAIKNKSKGEISNIECLFTKQDTLYNCYLLEKKILEQFKDKRVSKNWSTELFDIDILSQIKSLIR